MLKKHPTGFYSFALIFLLAIFSIGSWFERYQTVALLPAYLSSFIGCLFLVQEKESPRLLFSIGLLARLILFFSIPSLSDDIYRFIWDGTLLNNGLHPFAELPGYYLTKEVPGITPELYNQLNSPEYFTIYPPINQFVFASATWLSSDWLVTTNVIRALLSGADIGAFILLRKLLQHYQKPVHLAFWYFLNPLVLLEFTGNVHFEGLVIFFLLAGIYLFEIKKNFLSSIGLGLAIGSKLLPLIYLPYLLFQGFKSNRWWVAILAGAYGALTLIPLVDESFINGLSTSLNLYFQTFEFNASLYFIARQIGFWVYGYNNIALIGPLLSVVSLLSILALSFIAVKKQWSIPKTFLFILTSYLLLATTVHPWYIIPLIALGVLSGYWYPVVWSAMIFTTYFGYTLNGFELPMWVVVIEYTVVFLVGIWEFGKRIPTFKYAR